MAHFVTEYFKDKDGKVRRKESNKTAVPKPEHKENKENKENKKEETHG